MKYRNLTDLEIVDLENHLCTADDWSTIFVAPNFNTSTIYNSHFSGVVRIDSQTEKIQLYGGIKRQTGIYNSTVHNCDIGKNCYINYIKNYIANYTVGDNVIISNVQLIVNEGENSFGNGERIAVLDESGGREIIMYDKLSAQIAYISTLYRHREKLIKKIEQLILEYADENKDERGIIGDNSRITNTGTIKNVKIGDFTVIEGSRSLCNGSIISNEIAPVKIGNDIIFDDFIIQSGTTITDGVILSRCYVGQGCELGKNYSAENSVFFANCQGFHGEACSIFAGPFTVTHHKSTLLIAGMYSFLNAGSGSNQSNHMYKLGPIHQGIVERGSKTTSDSYLLWPAKIGPFTLVMGRHYKNSDTSNMPFSYLIEGNDKSWLAPAVNLQSVGTSRDAAKWPKRDKRVDHNKLDRINFNILSPYTIQKMLNGISILENIQNISGPTSVEYSYNNTSISSSALRKGISLYNIGVDKFLGNSVITRIKNINFKSIEELRDRLQPESNVGKGDWIDIGGLFAPKNEVYKYLDQLENGEINSLEIFENKIKELHENYYEIEWNWSAELLKKRIDKPIEEITLNDLIGLVQRWKKCVIELDQMLYSDAKKEFQLSSMTGFGADGDASTQIADFEKVRGKFETNDFVAEIKSHIQRKTQLGNDIIDRLKSCSTDYNI